MKKKIISAIIIATLTVSMTACGGSTDSEQVAELEVQIEELQQQLEEAKQGQTGSSTSTSNFDSETQSLINSVNEETAEYQGICGADAKWYYKDNVLVIKGTGEITDNPWQLQDYKDKISINWLFIDEGITSIYCSGAFSGDITSTLAKVALPSTLVKIGDKAFSGCQSLTSINIPNSVTTIEDNAFDSCRGLTNITIPNGVTSIGSGAFMRCSGLTHIEIPDGVTEIEDYTFSGCTSINSVIIPNGVETIGYDAFSGCKSLNNVIIPDGVTEIGGSAFYSCKNLTNILIPDSVTEIGIFAFSSCDSLDKFIIEKIECINPDALKPMIPG